MTQSFQGISMAEVQVSNPIPVQSRNTALNPFISVIIPVYRDRDKLETCLNHLANQSYPADRYEVIVVDNGSDNFDGIKALVERYDNAIIVQEPTPGSYAARNKGIAAASGDVLAFTDADCLPSPTWLETGTRYLVDNPHCGAIGGRIEMFYENPKNVTVADLFDRVIFGFPYQEMLEGYGGMITANIFTRKTVIEDIGPFLGHIKSFGDQEWGMRVRAAGYGQIYADDAWVRHPVRGTFKTIARKKIRCSGGVFDLYIRNETSWLVRYRRLAKLIFEDIVVHTPPQIATAMQDPRLAPWPTRLQIIQMILIMQVLSAWEKVRLFVVGGNAERL